MYGGPYNQNMKAVSPPPLHHPVPVHPIPQVRSPPPSQQPHTRAYAPPYDPSHLSSRPPPQPQYAQQFGQFLGVNDTTAQMGLHVVGNVMGSSQAYVEQNVLRFFNTSALKPYFNVSTPYVIRKLYLILVPWRHKPWSRQVRRNEITGTVEGYKSPREDINAPDLYIPVMAFVTYILLSAFLSGIQGHFSPEDFSVTASYAFAIVLFEFLAIKLGCYLLSIGGQGQVLDLVAYGGYKFVGIVVTMLVRLAGLLRREESNKGGRGRWIEWTVFIYTFLGLGFFMLRSLRYVILSDSGPTVDVGVGTSRGKSRRLQFLSGISIVQLIFMWLLTGNA